MYDTVREEMTRYPVFSYQENHTFDESEVFKDEDITKNNNKKNIFNSQLNHPYKKRTQTIVNIYGTCILIKIKLTQIMRMILYTLKIIVFLNNIKPSITRPSIVPETQSFLSNEIKCFMRRRAKEILISLLAKLQLPSPIKIP